MSGYRPSAYLRHLHDEMRCPDSCPICARIEAADVERRVGRDLLVTSDFQEER